MRLGVDAYRRNMFLYLSTPKWIGSLEEHAVEEGTRKNSASKILKTMPET